MPRGFDIDTDTDTDTDVDVDVTPRYFTILRVAFMQAEFLFSRCELSVVGNLIFVCEAERVTGRSR